MRTTRPIDPIVKTHSIVVNVVGFVAEPGDGDGSSASASDPMLRVKQARLYGEGRRSATV